MSKSLTLADLALDPSCLTVSSASPSGLPLTLRLLLPGDGDRLGHFFAGLSTATRNCYAPHPLTLEFGQLLCAELDYTQLGDVPSLRFIGLIADPNEGGIAETERHTSTEPTRAGSSSHESSHSEETRTQEASHADAPGGERSSPATECRQTQDASCGDLPEGRTKFAKRQDVAGYFILTLGTRDGEATRYRERDVELSPDTTCTFAPCVADAYQSQGVGSALIPGILDAARRLGFHHMVLSGGTRTANHRAIRFYEKAGFRKVGEFETKDKNGTPIGNQDMILEL